MSKKRKKELTMIDMTARLNMKVTPGTIEESIKLQKELDEINISIENKMRIYEERLKLSFESILSEEIIVSNQDVEYFINAYWKTIENRNMENISNRIKQYRLYLENHIF